MHRSTTILRPLYRSICVSRHLQLGTTTTTTKLHPFKSLFSKITWVSQYQKCKTSLDFNEVRDDGVLGWQWHQLDHMQTICTSLQTDNHNSTSALNFYRPEAGCSSWHPTNSVKALKAKRQRQSTSS